MAADDPWSVLGIPPGSSREQVREAYRELAKVWHPDRFAHENERLRQRATRELQRINEAYERLKDGKAAGSARSGRATAAPPPGTARHSLHRKVFQTAFWILMPVLFFIALRFGLLFRYMPTTLATLVLLPMVAGAAARLAADTVLGKIRDSAGK